MPRAKDNCKSNPSKQYLEFAWNVEKSGTSQPTCCFLGIERAPAELCWVNQWAKEPAEFFSRQISGKKTSICLAPLQQVVQMRIKINIGIKEDNVPCLFFLWVVIFVIIQDWKPSLTDRKIGSLLYLASPCASVSQKFASLRKRCRRHREELWRTGRRNSCQGRSQRSRDWAQTMKVIWENIAGTFRQR